MNLQMLTLKVFCEGLVVLVVLGVVLEQVEAVAKPLLLPVLKKPPPGPPKPPGLHKTSLK